MAGVAPSVIPRVIMPASITLDSGVFTSFL
jgi:hypothetical protein